MGWGQLGQRTSSNLKNHRHHQLNDSLVQRKLSREPSIDWVECSKFDLYLEDFGWIDIWKIKVILLEHSQHCLQLQWYLVDIGNFEFYGKRIQIEHRHSTLAQLHSGEKPILPGDAPSKADWEK